MILNFKNSLRVAFANLVITAVDAGTGPGIIRLYDGTIPAGGPDAAVTTQNLLAELTLSDPCGTVNGTGLITFSAITEDSQANYSSTASWARVLDSDLNAVADMDVSLAAGTGALKMNTLTVIQTGPVVISDLTIQM